ncbi:hypothetical protein U3A58_14605 [Algoriphagus sp. C2-6-M1]|uniref:hypothetical protein n=1 Tax=Algoriphagus persicinus TaxID=3108754 RepID=UPI002B3B0339|nr:hypothetical protein [Algoriphagus sp. C2-6-M1]MEB2781625.1 hypothetical protein [Algoriphagus sp. C2-6-M1]
MKNINTLILALFGLVVFQACEGPEGPQGAPGFDGEDGVNIVSEVFEVEVDFTAANDYSEIFSFDPIIVESDVVLSFVLWEVDGQTPIWRAMPQTAYFQEGGILVYNYDFTRSDFSLFLDGNLDLSTLSTDWTDNQLFRVVVLPGDFTSTNARIDLTDYDAVTKLLGLNDADFKRIELK